MRCSLNIKSCLLRYLYVPCALALNMNIDAPNIGCPNHRALAAHKHHIPDLRRYGQPTSSISRNKLTAYNFLDSYIHIFCRGDAYKHNHPDNHGRKPSSCMITFTLWCDCCLFYASLSLCQHFFSLFRYDLDFYYTKNNCVCQTMRMPRPGLPPSQEKKIRVREIVIMVNSTRTSWVEQIYVRINKV